MKKKIEIIFINNDYHILRNDNLLNNVLKINNIYIFNIFKFTTNIVIII